VIVRTSERGSVLVEFALVSLILYVLLAASIDFGRLMFSAQAAQDAARVAARELAVAPLPAEISFADALAYEDPVTGFSVPRRIFNPACLTIDRDAFAGAADPDAALDAFVDGLPLVNKALRPLMFVDVGAGTNLLRFPGAVLDTDVDATCFSNNAAYPSLATQLTVGIPRVTGRSEEGVETIAWLPVLEEIRSGNPPAGQFGLAGGGLVAVRINYPYQAATMSSHRPNPEGPAEPTIGRVNLAADGEVDPAGGPPGTTLVMPNDEADDLNPNKVYSGAYGLGRQYAYVNQPVRPYRRLISTQAIYRREVFQ
jgi:hypothetical protein